MPILTKALPLAAAAAVIVWIALSGYVLVNRLLYEALQRRTISALPRRVVMRMAADRSTPAWLGSGLAAHAITRWGEARLLKDAVRHRGEGGRWRRIAALRVLVKAGHAESLPLLETAIGCGDATVVDAAVGLLGNVPDRRAALALFGALERRLYNPSRVATALERFPLDIADQLLPRLGHADPVVRFWAAVLLERWPHAAGLGARLASLATDPDACVRKAAVDTLSRIGAPEAAAAAVKLLDDPVLFVRAHAARALGELRRVDLAEHLLPLLADRE